MEGRKILQRIDRIQSLPTLPNIALQVNAMLQDLNTSIQELQAAIEKDQAIVPKLLKLVNSSFFGLRSRISNLTHAIVLLGFNPIRNAIVSLSVIEAFSNQARLENFDIKQFWVHSVAAAVISKHLAHEIGYSSPEDAFTGGLVHDIGKIILCQYLRDMFAQAWKSALANHLSFHQAERKELPINHARLGAYLAARWNLPAALTETIQHHHNVRMRVRDQDLLFIVHTADYIVNCRLETPPNSAELMELDPDAEAFMSPVLRTIEEWWPEQKEEIETAGQFLLESSSAG